VEVDACALAGAAALMPYAPNSVANTMIAFIMISPMINSLDAV
jgi:hypothetical protein